MNDREIATDLITTAKANNEMVLVTLVDGTQISGSPISVNSKGVNLKVDEKVRSFALSRVDAIDLVTADEDEELEDEVDADEEAFMDESQAESDLEDIYAQLHDGMTTAELAALFGIEPKELRVHLRSLGLGVGKGRKYSLAASDYRLVKDLIAATN